MASNVKPLITVSDLDAMPDDGCRYEVVDGELFVSKAPGVSHQLISAGLTMSLGSYLKQNPIGKVVPTPGVILDELNGVIPDLLVITNERMAEVRLGEKITGAPELMIEILSPGRENQKRDRVIKRQLFGKFGVQEYWIVDPETESIDVYRLEGDVLNLSATLSGSDILTTTLLPSYQCSLASIFSEQH